jgi:hypothetical protein
VAGGASLAASGWGMSWARLALRRLLPSVPVGWWRNLPASRRAMTVVLAMQLLFQISSSLLRFVTVGLRLFRCRSGTSGQRPRRREPCGLAGEPVVLVLGRAMIMWMTWFLVSCGM